MAYVAYVTELKNLRKHPNADRLQLAECFGNTVCVSLEYKDGQLGVYFPTDGQLSVEYAEQNNLLRKKDENGNNIGGYMDPDKRNVTSIRLRGEKSDGLFMPLHSFDYCFEDGTATGKLKLGDTIDVVNGHEICTKYIPARKHKQGHVSEGNKTRKKKVEVAPLFSEHADTEQLAYNLAAFKPGDLIEITLKMHGTSQRTAYLPVFKGEKKTLFQKLFRKAGVPIYDWGYVSGTRRVVLDNYEGGFYGSNEFREQHSKMFEGKLHKGETVYYEVVGFTTSGAPIMGDASNKKLNDKEFLKQYGETTRFSYGCAPDGYVMMWGRDDEGQFSIPADKPQSDVYVYRMTITNEDGDVVEYSPAFMRYRCEQMGVKTVPVLWAGYIPAHTGDPAAIALGQTAGEWIKEKAEEFYDGPDPIGKTHVREGVVVRIIDRPKFAAYKHKNFSFKVLEGIIKDTAEAPDMEEAQEVAEEVVTE